MRHRRFVAGVLVLVMAALAACSSSGGAQVVHVEEGVTETQAAQTAWAVQHPSPTPGPSPTPTATGTPYVLPTADPGVEGSTVITRVGERAITLSDFQKRVRFERWRQLYVLMRIVEKRGLGVLDLTRAENQTVASLFATLADSNSFGNQVHRVMVIDEIALQEAARRNLEVDPYQFDAKLGEFLGLQVGEGGKLPPEFDAEYPRFLAGMKTYTGMNEEELRRVVRALTLYYEEQFLIGQSPEAIPADKQARIGMEVEDVLVGTGEQADEVMAQLKAGKSMKETAAALGFTLTGEGATRLLRWSDPNLPPEVRDAVFAAKPNTIVGPIATSQGWYVALVHNEVYDVLSPQDIDALRKQYFLDWVEGQMDDTAYVHDFDNWFPYIPQDPLPRDVSPLFRDENVMVPTDLADPLAFPQDMTQQPTEPVGNQ